MIKQNRVEKIAADVLVREADKEQYFMEDMSGTIIQDDALMRLLSFPNVFVTAHQAFFTRDAVRNIASTTINNITAFERGDLPPTNIVSGSKP